MVSNMITSTTSDTPCDTTGGMTGNKASRKTGDKVSDAPRGAASKAAGKSAVNYSAQDADKPKDCAHSTRQPDQSPLAPLCGCSSRTFLGTFRVFFAAGHDTELPEMSGPTVMSVPLAYLPFGQHQAAADLGVAEMPYLVQVFCNIFLFLQ